MAQNVCVFYFPFISAGLFCLLIVYGGSGFCVNLLEFPVTPKGSWPFDQRPILVVLMTSQLVCLFASIIGLFGVLKKSIGGSFCGFFLLLGVFLFLEIFGFVALRVSKNEVNMALFKGIRENNTSEDYSEWLIDLQWEHGCCGIVSYMDWNLFNPPGEVGNVPDTCCLRTNLTIPSRQCGHGVLFKNLTYLTENPIISLIGCGEKLSHIYSESANKLGFEMVLVGAFCLFFSIFLYCGLARIACFRVAGDEEVLDDASGVDGQNQDPGSNCDGYNRRIGFRRNRQGLIIRDQNGNPIPFKQYYNNNLKATVMGQRSGITDQNQNQSQNQLYVVPEEDSPEQTTLSSNNNVEMLMKPSGKQSVQSATPKASNMSFSVFKKNYEYEVSSIQMDPNDDSDYDLLVKRAQLDAAKHDENENYGKFGRKGGRKLYGNKSACLFNHPNPSLPIFGLSDLPYTYRDGVTSNIYSKFQQPNQFYHPNIFQNHRDFIQKQQEIKQQKALEVQKQQQQEGQIQPNSGLITSPPPESIDNNGPQIVSQIDPSIEIVANQNQNQTGPLHLPEPSSAPGDCENCAGKFPSVSANLSAIIAQQQLTTIHEEGQSSKWSSLSPSATICSPTVTVSGLVPPQVMDKNDIILTTLLNNKPSSSSSETSEAKPSTQVVEESHPAASLSDYQQGIQVFQVLN